MLPLSLDISRAPLDIYWICGLFHWIFTGYEAFFTGYLLRINWIFLAQALDI